MNKVSCLEDNVFKWTTTANSFFAKNLFMKRSITIGLGIINDALLLTLLYYWTLKGNSWRYPLALTMMYTLRIFLAVSQ